MKGVPTIVLLEFVYNTELAIWARVVDPMFDTEKSAFVDDPMTNAGREPRV